MSDADEDETLLGWTKDLPMSMSMPMRGTPAQLEEATQVTTPAHLRGPASSAQVSLYEALSAPFSISVSTVQRDSIDPLASLPSG